MLRGLVLLFVVLNVALYFWIDSDPRWGQSEREPERLQHQVSPSAIQALPDLPASTADGVAAPKPGEVSLKPGEVSSKPGEASPEASGAPSGATAP